MILRNSQELLLLLQGGLGNQLLQLVLGESLAQAHGLRLVGSLALLESSSRSLRGLTSRRISPLVGKRVPLVPRTWHRHVLARITARIGRPLTRGVLTDSLLLAEANRGSSLLEQLAQIRVIHSHATHPNIFGAEFISAWQAILQEIQFYRQECDVAIAIHVRRSDYLNPRSRFWTMGEPYYRRAIAKALMLLPTGSTPPIIHVCSDDPAGCQEHLQDPSWQLKIACGTPEQDLATMVEAQVLITSNSSLSAIAGHLAQLRDPRTPVLTPGCWLRNPAGRLGDLRKPNWQVVIP